MRLRLVVFLLSAGVLVATPLVVTTASGRRDTAPTAIYRNRAYSSAERAADLVARMTLAEKAAQAISSKAPAIPRLGVASYGWWNEALHGVSRIQYEPKGNSTVLNNTTSYPISLALGSSWDPALMYREATAISDEAREVAPDNALNLDFYSPTVNLGRDPRWGRNDEAFSEDPLLTSTIASQFVDGMEGKTPSGTLLPQGGGYLKTITTIKHYAANNTEGDRIGGPSSRLSGTSNMDERTLREYYTAQFRQLIQQAHPGSIMSSYNSVNNVPAAANIHLIDTLARQIYGFTGYFTSDCDAVYEIAHGHHYQPPGYNRPVNNTERNALAQAAGEDLNCNAGYADSFNYANSLPTAAGQGILTPTDTYSVNDLDTSLVRLFTARMQLGEFDNVSREPWVTAARARVARGTWTNSDANHAVTETPARLQLARQVADHGFVLLKNASAVSAHKVLPLHVPHSGPYKVAVIGYFANPASMYLGGYSSQQGAPGTAKEVTPYAGIKRAIQAADPSATVDYYSGFTGHPTTASELTTIDPAAVKAAGGYDAVVVYVGTDDSTASEFADRTTMALPGQQAQLINQVAAANPHTAVVMESIGQVDVGSFAAHVPALLWTSYNGQRKGDAVADVLLGTYDPSGHLPFTWYPSVANLPALTDYAIRPSADSPGRTYMYYRGPSSFPFGYGLSYTTFRTSGLRADRTNLSADDRFTASVEVTNTGSRTGSDLVQLYVSEPDARAALQRPVKRLEGYEQVELAPGQSKRVSLTVKVPDLAFYDPKANRMAVDDGRYGVQIADSADDVLAQQFVTVHGAMTPVPAAVSAKPVMDGDGTRHIQQRVMYPEGVTVAPQLTVSMNDQSLYGYIHAGDSRALPRGMQVSFASNRPSVAAIGPGGAIRTVSNGVATITATVRYRGVKRSTTFVVRVLSELAHLTVGGRGVTGFHPDTQTYNVIVPAGESAPRVAASSPDPRATVSVTQAEEVPGEATVRVTGPDGITITYSLFFAHPARSEDFGGADVGPQWSWVRRDPSAEQVSGGSLTITPQTGDLSGAGPLAHNLLLQPALGNWTVTSKLTLSHPPTAAGQQAGIIAYQDDADWLTLGWAYSGGSAQLVQTASDSLSGTQVTQVLATAPASAVSGNTIWLAMRKTGPRYATAYSTDGVHYTPVYNVGQSLQNVRVGVFAWNGSATTSGPTASFDFFHITNGP